MRDLDGGKGRGICWTDREEPQHCCKDSVMDVQLAETERKKSSQSDLMACESVANGCRMAGSGVAGVTH